MEPVVVASLAAGWVVATGRCTSAGGWYHSRMPILPYLEHSPRVGPGVALANDAFLVGRVQVAGPALFEASAVVRGDQNGIEVGPRFRMGRGSSIHVELPTPTLIGTDVWLGDDAVVRGPMRVAPPDVTGGEFGEQGGAGGCLISHRASMRPRQ